MPIFKNCHAVLDRASESTLSESVNEHDKNPRKKNGFGKQSQYRKRSIVGSPVEAGLNPMGIAMSGSKAVVANNGWRQP